VTVAAADQASSRHPVMACPADSRLVVVVSETRHCRLTWPRPAASFHTRQPTSKVRLDSLRQPAADGRTPSGRSLWRTAAPSSLAQQKMQSVTYCDTDLSSLTLSRTHSLISNTALLSVSTIINQSIVNQLFIQNIPAKVLD